MLAAAQSPLTRRIRRLQGLNERVVVAWAGGGFENCHDLYLSEVRLGLVFWVWYFQFNTHEYVKSSSDTT